MDNQQTLEKSQLLQKKAEKNSLIFFVKTLTFELQIKNIWP